ncbi:MAG: hypothetical protein ABIK89_08685, partial [Planctomycetota bacterium]
MSTTKAIAPIAQDLIDAIEAIGIDRGRMDYSVSDDRVPEHTIRFADKGDFERLRTMLEKKRVSTHWNIDPTHPCPYAMHFSGATRVKKTTRALKAAINGKPKPMRKAEAARLVAEIQNDVKALATKLRELRERLGWKSLGYDSWAECVKVEFDRTKDWANKQIKAAEIRERVNTKVSTESPSGGELPETYARELARLPDDQQAGCYADYADECATANEKMTAAGLREKVDVWKADDEGYVDENHDDPVAEGH